MHYLTRIAYNSRGWKGPTAEARELEGEGTYNRENGFGHEDWLFRTDWQIDGWRYAFLQGVNKSHDRLEREQAPFDVTLFTIRPDGVRQLVATIRDVECLSEDQAKAALEGFKRRGWYDAMLEDIEAVGGNKAALGAWEWSKYILNIRFRQECVYPVLPRREELPRDLLRRYTRYQLYSLEPAERGREGKGTLPAIAKFIRRGTASTEVTPEHAMMQAKLMKELQVEFPDGTIRREEDYIDVSVRLPSELLLFEIKSDLEPKMVIRQAIGQLLEYGFHPARSHDLPRRLVIVGRRELSQSDAYYLELLQKQFGIPVSYRVVSI